MLCLSKLVEGSWLSVLGFDPLKKKYAGECVRGEVAEGCAWHQASPEASCASLVLA